MDLLVKNSSFQQPSVYRHTCIPEAVYTILNSTLYSPDSNFNHSLNSIYVIPFNRYSHKYAMIFLFPLLSFC